MSFILDALRKSENERQRQATPGIADARYRVSKPGSKRWLPVLIIALAANALLLVAMLLDRGPDAESPRRELVIAAPAETSPLPVTPAVPAGSPDIGQRRSLADEVREPEPAHSAPAIAAAPPAAGPASPPPDRAGAGTDLPSLEQLSIAGLLSLPPLHVDIHVFSEDKAERFVFINMAKYQEGEALKEGPVIEEINESGVVLSHQGQEFLLNRE